MTWTWNNDYKDHSQVEEFYPAYLKVRDEITTAGRYPYNDSFKGRIPGIEGPREDTAIYMLQSLHQLRELEARISERRDAGWRDMRPGELDHGTVKYEAIAEYGFCVGGTGFRQWEDARLQRYHSSTRVLPKRARTNGHLISGKLLVKD